MNVAIIGSRDFKNKELLDTTMKKIQENDTWVEAIIYKPNDCEELFIRTCKEFELKFKKEKVTKK